MKKQAHVFFSGTVQGVGFRYTARDIADELGVLGRVKNLTSGEVEVVAEAEEETLRLFLSKVNQYYHNYITDVHIEWFPATGEFANFRIALL